MCVGGGGEQGLPRSARKWKVLESVLILKESPWPIVGVAWAHAFLYARLQGPSSHLGLAFQVVLRESTGGLVHGHMYICSCGCWVHGAVPVVKC